MSLIPPVFLLDRRDDVRGIGIVEVLGKMDAMVRNKALSTLCGSWLARALWKHGPVRFPDMVYTKYSDQKCNSSTASLKLARMMDYSFICKTLYFRSGNERKHLI